MLILQPVDSLDEGKRIQVCIYSCKALSTALVLCGWMNDYVTSKFANGRLCFFSLGDTPAASLVLFWDEPKFMFSTVGET